MKFHLKKLRILSAVQGMHTKLTIQNWHNNPNEIFQYLFLFSEISTCNFNFPAFLNFGLRARMAKMVQEPLNLYLLCLLLMNYELAFQPVCPIHFN